MKLGSSELGGIVVEHFRSLPRWADHQGLGEHLPWLVVFLVVPTYAAVGLALDVDAKAVGPGLLAGAGVLGGLLFSVLAWIAGRIGAMADAMEGQRATPTQLDLVRRLDIARANTAYAAGVSIVFVVELGVSSMLRNSPIWLNGLSVFLLFHFGFTLLLVLTRINRIGRGDRIAVLTAHARGPQRRAG